MFENKSDGSNLDLENYTLQQYLDMTEGFESSFPDFKVINSNGFNVIDESQACEVGFKARAAEMLMDKLKSDGVKEIVYVQPRRGFAGISLSYLCKKYEMDLTLIMPSSKEVSDHQLLCIDYGAKPLFLRIAAMPNANSIAKKYSEKTGAYYIPLGLKHKLVTALAVRLFYDFFEFRTPPRNMWTVISTGVLTRALQIALPHTNFKAVAVSRNIQKGELGRAEFYSYHKPFNSKSDYIPVSFDCENSYDSKGYDYMERYGKPGDWFFSVAGNAPVSRLNPKSIDSYRDWGDKRDFKGII